MQQWFCTKCHRVFIASAEHAKCCGAIEPFNPSAHGEKLIGSSNSWISVWERWREHPLLREAATDMYESGNQGAAMILNAFIERLLDAVTEASDGHQ